MTIVVVCITVLASVVSTIWAVSIATVTSTRTRAQLAADSAALAAVQLSVPGRRGLPEETARRYAGLNGARLIECWCESGDTAMQVEVAIGNVHARARAVFDPSLLAPMRGTAGLDQRLAVVVDTLVRAARGAVWVVSGWRSHDDQESLWAHAVAEHGSPEAADDWVARPGTSMHERGLAVDLGGDLALARRLIADLQLPLTAPLPNEPWHFELAP